MMILKIISLFFTLVSADVYLHNPRGSNNRCDRRTNDRRNANRLFDSQNNAAGGYAISCNRPENANSPDNITCFQMNYYTNTIIPIRWTTQHNCGDNNDGVYCSVEEAMKWIIELYSPNWKENVEYQCALNFQNLEFPVISEGPRAIF